MGTALVTGATSGIGKEIAWQLAGEGNDLVLVARNTAALEDYADRLRNFTGQSIEVLSADLATEEGARAVADRTASREKPIGLVVNNAGFGLGQDFIGGSLERELQAIDVMARAILIICHSAANEFARRGYGAILNVSSMTSLTAQGTYSAHKAWVRTFSEGLAETLKPYGVSVTVSCPGLVHTEFHERTQVDASQWPDLAFIPVDKVASRSLDAVRRGRVIVTPSPLYAAAAGFLRLAPRRLVRSVAGPGRSGRHD
ncbi:SDR family NAD(P)-dependent oxidoreductase [Flaviflexus equikiangi]|uniref:SDR family NAD(P)-dependent oxidoreductase n=1 Tax=Flaviflexus equikiangi TaxID=2758573 RepID=A0ABS2TH07_9ACTO|nr:SDR family NAD(P)-dependent oxidoreductase [Flaviflexus equikiangi]MBM9433940.1 SDR family NAD(P)-dependent oxidoreductase [Flaviflexus equikiangi]